MSLELFGWNAVYVYGLMTLLWIASVRLRDASIVDPWWSISFLVVTFHTALHTGLTPAKTVLLIVVAAWALRLWLHLLVRSIGKPEDPRYVNFRKRYGAERYWWVSFFQVFLLQGTLALLISTPLQLAAAAPLPDELSLNHYIGLALFVVGFLCETVADWQLTAFRRNPANKGQVLHSGLWRWSRHPNYFGESLLWWGFWCFALGQPYGWLTALAPAFMTFLLLKVSGVTMLDAQLKRTKPDYDVYMRRTSAFVPLPPKKLDPQRT